MTSDQAGPKFIRFFWPVISSVRELGGAAKPREVVDHVLDAEAVGDDERAERLKSGALRVENQVHWARNYLVWAGLLDGSTRGVWALTPDGWQIDLDVLTHEDAHGLFKRLREERGGDWGRDGDGADAEAPEDSGDVRPLDKYESADQAVTKALRAALQSLSHSGFERLCRQLLGRIGLVQVVAVGKAGDRGIDVEGLLRVNAVVSFRVGVQCKLYGEGNKITPRHIREFQGALGPFDRGIFMTTSVFTRQAEVTASAPGSKPVDLIDGERLIELLLENDLGTKLTKAVDEDFFEPFR